MNRMIAVSFTALSLIAAAPVFAQDVELPAVEVSLIPAGGTFFTAKGSSPDFGNYTYGAAVTYNINPIVGIEGEVGGTAGISQDLTFGNAVVSNTRTPDTLNYNANVVLSAPTGRSVVPFITGGVGGLTMFDRPALGIGGRTTFLTGNIGGGVKWYAPSRRWGLRGDYRFIGVRADNQAPAFFGRETRYGHRVYGAVIINALGR